ncbi:hypothetical protein GX411_10120, partial [Candidatus Fermentibacteria bacterium]|nr:hypothetical protein [Candidatus Fermentibacteria bacterium]
SQGAVSIRILDLAGRVVSSRVETPGPSGDAWFWWDASSSDGVALEPGVYVVTASSADGLFTGRIVLTR